MNNADFFTDNNTERVIVTANRIGKKTIEFSNDIRITSYGSIVGKKEYEGPIGEEFDEYTADSFFGEKTFEKAEIKLQKHAVNAALSKGGISKTDINCIFAGDLLNQCVGSSFAARESCIPFVGLYGACSTMALSLIMSALSIESGAVQKAVAVTSSHFCSAERQYRFPLDYGNQRTQNAQWTVTGAGAAVVSQGGAGPKISKCTIGEIVDLGVTDANNMGAAMAPAAASTLTSFFKDTDTSPDDYDIIFTGDLGAVGTNLLYGLMLDNGYDIRCRHNDCGLIIFDSEAQDVHAGGSGCGCSAAVLCSFIMHRFESGDFNNILFISTGALMSPTTNFQGESIPGIAHLVNIVKQ